MAEVLSLGSASPTGRTASTSTWRCRTTSRGWPRRQRLQRCVFWVKFKQTSYTQYLPRRMWAVSHSWTWPSRRGRPSRCAAEHTFWWLKLSLHFFQVNINIPKSDKSRSRGKGGGGILPPPPGVGAIKAPPSAAAPGASSLTPLSSPVSNSVDLLGGLDLSSLAIQQPPSNPPVANLPQPASTQSKYAASDFTQNLFTVYRPFKTIRFRSDDPWGAFESAEGNDGKVSKEWVGFWEPEWYFHDQQGLDPWWNIRLALRLDAECFWGQF